MIMICDHASICPDKECFEAKPHIKGLYCSVECDQNGTLPKGQWAHCIPVMSEHPAFPTNPFRDSRRARSFDEDAELAFRSLVSDIGRHARKSPVFPLEPGKKYVLLDANYWQSLRQAAGLEGK